MGRKPEVASYFPVALTIQGEIGRLAHQRALAQGADRPWHPAFRVRYGGVRRLAKHITKVLLAEKDPRGEKSTLALQLEQHSRPWRARIVRMALMGRRSEYGAMPGIRYLPHPSGVEVAEGQQYYRVRRRRGSAALLVATALDDAIAHRAEQARQQRLQGWWVQATATVSPSRRAAPPVAAGEHTGRAAAAHEDAPRGTVYGTSRFDQEQPDGPGSENTVSFPTFPELKYRNGDPTGEVYPTVGPGELVDD